MVEGRIKRRGGDNVWVDMEIGRWEVGVGGIWINWMWKKVKKFIENT